MDTSTVMVLACCLPNGKGGKMSAQCPQFNPQGLILINNNLNNILINKKGELYPCMLYNYLIILLLFQF